MRGVAGIRADEGTTLVEVLAAVALIGIAFLTILGGMMTSAVGSDIHRKATTADNELRALAEHVHAADYVACAGPAAYASGFTAPAGYTAHVTAVRYWVSSASDPDTGSFSGTCGTDAGSQLVSLRVEAADGRAAATRDVLKVRL